MPELLLVGQAYNAAAPVNGNAELYVQSPNGYGTPYGTSDALLRYECQDFAPQGGAGRVIGRRLWVTIEHDRECTLRITPILDFVTDGTPVTFSLVAPSTRRRRILDVPFARNLTYVRCKIEVLSRGGIVWIHKIQLGFRPLTQSFEEAGGRDA